MSSSGHHCSSHVSHGCSKAQACLKKILHIISSIPPPPPSNERGFNIDLNKCLLDTFQEFKESESLDSSACSFVRKQIHSEKTTEASSSDITNLQETTTTEVAQESKKIKQEDDEDVVETSPVQRKESQNGRKNNNDCLGLLIEAAEMISRTEFQCSSPEQTQTQHVDKSKTSASKRVTLDVEDTSPVLRSKRGRNQVLPSRYRDSVLLLEPCKRRRQPPAAAKR